MMAIERYIYAVVAGLDLTVKCEVLTQANRAVRVEIEHKRRGVEEWHRKIVCNA